MAPRSKNRSQGRRGDSLLPNQLISREALVELRARLRGEGIPLAANEPDWDTLRRSLQQDRGLTEASADELTRALERLWLLPFHRYDTCAPLLVFYFAELPSIEKQFRARHDKDGLTLSAAFRVMTEVMLQGIALFPGEPHYIAAQLMAALQSPTPQTRRYVLALARLLATARDSHCGGNRYLSEDADAIAIYEHLARRGRYEGVVARPQKYASYVRQLERNSQFWKEWSGMKATFADLEFWDYQSATGRVAAFRI